MADITKTQASLVKKILEEKFLLVIFAGLIVTTIYRRSFPHYSWDDFKVIYSLGVFLVIVRGLEQNNFFLSLADWFEKGKFLGLKLVLFSALLSAFVTNDVALLFIVPFTLTLSIPHKKYIVILEAVTANISSSLFPFGNPQNMFIYYHYHLHFLEFIRVIWPFVFFLLLPALVLSSFLALRSKKSTSFNTVVRPFAFAYIVFFVIFVLAVLGVLPLSIGWIILAVVFVWERNNFKIDYLLLFTFLVFFGFTDNLTHILHFNLHNSRHVFFTAVLSSQIISNVPAALLLADFTSNWQSLLWGVSVGGLGMVNGSIASLIALRIYKEKMQSDIFWHLSLAGFLFLLGGILAFWLH